MKEKKKIASMLKDISYILPIQGPKYFSKIAKKYKFEYVVHGDDWKKRTASLK